MQAVGIEPGFWKGRRVFLTGHTGFIGGWVSLWLQRLGADLTGYALDPPTRPSLFEAAAVGDPMRSIIGDIRDIPHLSAAIRDCDPEVVIHLAAQPLVREAYDNPIDTLAVNVMGTANLLQAMRGLEYLKSAVIMTTDKVYENVEWDHGYREDDRLGGREPYGVSKACAELVTDAFRASYFADKSAPMMATVRAGNVIGGGDWAADRLLPDAMRAFAAEKPLFIRNPASVRPWQHVLDPAAGILMLAERLADGDPSAAQGWNFGPPEEDTLPVSEIADEATRLWGKSAHWKTEGTSTGPYEAKLLSLNSGLARTRLGWRRRWSVKRALAASVEWYKAELAGNDMREFSMQQIAAYQGAN